ncbi:unnamed protein product [Pleuronectes platessa]|uniref:Uncharacterized protein n=1 Tax=Pleuronectes platessa TaxID=8262 RepID=A0A9N7Y596_PLEPL|nr:unnamed protein product [Pleuronectes platessa]
MANISKHIQKARQQHQEIPAELITACTQHQKETPPEMETVGLQLQQEPPPELEIGCIRLQQGITPEFETVNKQQQQETPPEMEDSCIQQQQETPASESWDSFVKRGLKIAVPVAITAGLSMLLRVRFGMTDGRIGRTLFDL